VTAVCYHAQHGKDLPQGIRGGFPGSHRHLSPTVSVQCYVSPMVCGKLSPLSITASITALQRPY